MALARAMMINPEIIGYDEPSALDPELRLEVEKLILQNKERGMTQIVVTHDLQLRKTLLIRSLRSIKVGLGGAYEEKENCPCTLFFSFFLTACTQKASDPSQDNWAKYQNR